MTGVSFLSSGRRNLHPVRSSNVTERLSARVIGKGNNDIDTDY